MLKRTLAIVEDEPGIRDNYADWFSRQGYQVVTFDDRISAEQAFEQRLPDLVLLDIGLQHEPDAGLELCRRLRQRSESLPIIFLTSRDSDIDEVVGLRLGADDYISKRVSLAQLNARVAALFRRIDALQEHHSPDSQILLSGSLQIDMARLAAEWQAKPVGLTVTELWILHALVKHPGHVKSRDQLMNAADAYVDPATISSHIKRIRKKFLQLDPEFSAIEAVYGAGYRWVENHAGPALST